MLPSRQRTTQRPKAGAPLRHACRDRTLDIHLGKADVDAEYQRLTATNQYTISIIPATCRLRLAKALNAGWPIITKDTNGSTCEALSTTTIWNNLPQIKAPGRPTRMALRTNSIFLKRENILAASDEDGVTKLNPSVATISIPAVGL